MVTEVEAKFLNIDKDLIISKLRAMGAKKAFEGNITSLHYDFPDKSLSKGMKSIKIRQKEGKAAEIVLKKTISKDEVKVAEKHILSVDNMSHAAEMLASIGMVEIDRRTKQRVTYVLSDATFKIDTVSGIPSFLDIAAADINIVRDKAKALGIFEKGPKPWSEGDVRRYYEHEED